MDFLAGVSVNKRKSNRDKATHDNHQHIGDYYHLSWDQSSTLCEIKCEYCLEINITHHQRIGHRACAEIERPRPVSGGIVMDARRNKKSWSAKNNVEGHSGERTATTGLGNTVTQQPCRPQGEDRDSLSICLCTNDTSYA